jgi:5-methyltetrahydrofolate--homocysteine methyltransferase
MLQPPQQRLHMPLEEQLLQPLLWERGAKPAGSVAIGTVKGDLHDIGKNLVASLLEGAGFEVINLGADVSPEKLIETIREKCSQIVCLSALLIVTMPSMKTTIETLKQAGLCRLDRVVLILSGSGASTSRESNHRGKEES